MEERVIAWANNCLIALCMEGELVLRGIFHPGHDKHKINACLPLKSQKRSKDGVYQRDSSIKLLELGLSLGTSQAMYIGPMFYI